ncbi:hypothetical protein GLW08_03695 [Pontibacillus yanchengensis]|uniref:Uncharacterized protein n=2 Tax=Pontibacillus yanchengensis TaxID=462910 RepID=A0A6I5A521_9BACI|nr:hypothetical protein [Pontibacillus yanchengensis]MYL35407.1 hypothetical protein [Pontibacillus yanchengensis]MYL52439.1 hypothetical protein [Pontibacillus yanchengensis]
MIWYLILSVISILLIIYTIRKHNDRRLLPFFLALAGIIHPFETIILVYLDAYHYTLGLFQNIYKDSVAGNFVSNLLAVPAASLFIAANQLKTRWFWVISGIFVLIEILFIHLDIFIPLWWKTYYTAILLPIHFFIGKKLWQFFCSYKYNEPPKWLLFFILYFACVSTLGALNFTLLGAYDLFHFQAGLYQDNFRDHLSVSIPHLFIFSFLLCKCITLKIPVGFTILILLIIDIIFMNTNTLHFTSLLAFATYIVLRIIMIWIVHLFLYFLTPPYNNHV